MKVFLNPGHDRHFDPGACGHGLKEAEVVWEISQLVEKYLKAAGVQVVGNVQDDNLAYVCSCANYSKADLFISIHCNAAGNPLARGTETFVFDFDSKACKLADCIQKQITDSLGTINRGIKEANFYVLRRTTMPAILVEVAFISNEDDAELLKTRQDEFARAIARGVTD